jgi:hypothetical protein
MESKNCLVEWPFGHATLLCIAPVHASNSSLMVPSPQSSTTMPPEFQMSAVLRSANVFIMVRLNTTGIASITPGSSQLECLCTQEFRP